MGLSLRAQIGSGGCALVAGLVVTRNPAVRLIAARVGLGLTVQDVGGVLAAPGRPVLVGGPPRRRATNAVGMPWKRVLDAVQGFTRSGPDARSSGSKGVVIGTLVPPAATPLWCAANPRRPA
jgi:hypothetical protein